MQPGTTKTNWNPMLKRFFQSETAATTTEYAILLAFIAGLLLITLISLGNESGTFWGRPGDTLQVIAQ